MLIISEGKMVFMRKEQVHLVTVPTTDNTLFNYIHNIYNSTDHFSTVLGSYTCGEKKLKSERKRMVDEFMVVCVDRIIASACFDPSVNGARSDCERPPSVNGGEDLSEVGLVECRICQEEDQVQAMEAPCACNGTLKFAHRKCIQRWCNKKGDITCEICNQTFSPNYSIPLARSNPDVMTIDISQTWGQEINLGDSSLLALAAAEHQLLQSEYEDYAAANTSSIVCLRSVVLFLLIVLLIRQAMMVTRDFEMALESSKFFNFQVSVLQFVGFLLPCYAMARSCCIIQSQRRRQG